MDKSIVEGNKLIAEFIGGKEIPLTGGTHIEFPKGMYYHDRYSVGQLKYHSSWDWLMPVVEKIESIHDDFHGYFGVHIYSNTCTIQGTKLRTDPENFHPAYMSDPNAILDTKIKSTWYNIVEFISWYNSQTQTTNKK